MKSGHNRQFPHDITTLNGTAARSNFLEVRADTLRLVERIPSKHAFSSHYRPASETPFQWRFDGGSIVASFYMHVTMYHSTRMHPLEMLIHY